VLSTATDSYWPPVGPPNSVFLGVRWYGLSGFGSTCQHCPVEVSVDIVGQTYGIN